VHVSRAVQETLLPMLITFLNDTNWELRAALFDNLTGASRGDQASLSRP
jgi:hypothetical protein